MRFIVQLSPSNTPIDALRAIGLGHAGCSRAEGEEGAFQEPLIRAEIRDLKSFQASKREPSC